MELPLFPVGEIVLLPGMSLPLHVFEPRYRELLGRVRASGEAFGIPCVLPGTDPDSRLARIGTLAHLTEVNYLPDGTADIVVVGGERYQILSIDRAAFPYAVAEARHLPLEPVNLKWVQATAREVLERFLLQVRPRFGDVAHEVPEDLLLQASFIAANLRLNGFDGQRVLEAKNLLERFEVLAGLVGVPERQLN